MILRVGIIGLGEVAQVSHISVLNNLYEYYQIKYLCHASKEALKSCSRRVNGELPKITSNPEDLIASPEVDVVLICATNVFYPSHAISSLQQHKSVLLEKPAALNYRYIDAMILAEKNSRGKVFVGYQRRYAEAFLDAMKAVGGMGKIQYARVRDIIMPNSTFVDQSGTFPTKWSDFPEESSEELHLKEEETVKEALIHDYEVEVTPEAIDIARILGGLGAHDLSAMREIIGVPKRVLGRFNWFAILECSVSV